MFGTYVQTTYLCGMKKTKYIRSYDFDWILDICWVIPTIRLVNIRPIKTFVDGSKLYKLLIEYENKQKMADNERNLSQILPE